MLPTSAGGIIPTTQPEFQDMLDRMTANSDEIGKLAKVVAAQQLNQLREQERFPDVVKAIASMLQGYC